MSVDKHRYGGSIFQIQTYQMAEVVRIASFIPVCISFVILFAAVASDLRSGQIPNLWICAGLAAGVLCRTLSWTSFGWGGFSLGLLLPFLICWIPFRMRGIGAGDVKLLLVIGALNGGQNVFFCIFFSFLFAAGISLGKLLSLKQFKKSLIQLFHYFQHIFLSGKIESYRGRYAKGHTIHFSVAILLGYAAWLGVNTCRSMLLL